MKPVRVMPWLLVVAACSSEPKLEELPPRAAPGVTVTPAQSFFEPPVQPTLPVMTLAPPTTPTQAVPLPVELRLLGENAQGYASALLTLREVRVFVEGKPLPLQLVNARVDLARASHAHLLARFDVPVGTKAVQVRIRFDEDGGFRQGNEAGAVDARGTGVEFEAPVAWLSKRGHAVVHLDAARSLVRRNAEERAFLPQHTVRY